MPGKMAGNSHSFGLLVRHFVAFSGWRAGTLLALMIVAALSEGIGLLLLVPLLTFVGLGGAASADNAIVSYLTGIGSRLGVPLTLEIVLAAFVFLVVIRQVIVYSSARIAAEMRIDYVASVRKEFFASLGATNWRYLTGARLNQLSQILLTDCWRIGEAALNLLRIMSSLVLLLANVIVAVILAPVLALSLLGSIALMMLLFGNRLAVVQEQGGKLTRMHTDVLRIVENYVENLRVAKMAGAVTSIQHEFSHRMDELGDELSGFAKEYEWTKMTLQLAGAVAVAVSLLVAVHIFDAGGAVLLLLILITARFIPRLNALNQNAHSLFHALPAFEHAYAVLNDCRAHPDEAHEELERPVVKRTIELRDVTVVADDSSGKRLLSDVSVVLEKHKILALIGRSGAGKSTLADVLSGLMQADSGTVRIDGQPLGAGQLVSWRNSVGYVPQTVVLLQDTIEHNLNWVLRSPAAELELQRVLRCVRLSKLTSELPDGLQTVVGRREGILSGGERQRLAIARELLRQPQLLILDEATSALDVDNETLVLDNIRQFFPGLTVLLITHRQTAIDKADRVVEMIDGKIAASGDKMATSC